MLRSLPAGCMQARPLLVPRPPHRPARGSLLARSPAPVPARACSALGDDVLPPGLNGDPNGYPIGKGADLFISTWNVHR